MGKKKHVVSEAVDELHDEAGGADGGACLTGHESKYRKASCSYRWQAHEESKGSRTSIYNKTPKGKSSKAGVAEGHLGTSGYIAASGDFFPAQYASQVPLPQEGDWFLHGPTRTGAKDVVGRDIPPGANFKVNWLWPYWHNVHHLIPKGTFNSTIDKVEPAKARELIRIGLLTAKYNINHHINSFILPQDMEVAAALALPRHLILEDGAAARSSEYFDHIDYNINVDNKLNKVINQYKKACDPTTNPECEAPDATLTKEQLENLSKQCMKKILDFGATSPGAAISDMPAI